MLSDQSIHTLSQFCFPFLSINNFYIHSLDVLDIELLCHHHNYTMFLCFSLINHIHGDPYSYIFRCEDWQKQSYKAMHIIYLEKTSNVGLEGQLLFYFWSIHLFRKCTLTFKEIFLVALVFLILIVLFQNWLYWFYRLTWSILHI